MVINRSTFQTIVVSLPQGTTELSQLLINESAKLDITIDIYIVKISFIGFQTYVQLSIFCAKIFEKC